MFVQFGKMFEHVFSKKHVTPNMHCHLHMLKQILDYGPPHTFWLFGFERMNGLLGAVPTNGKGIKAQFMRKFIIDEFILQKRQTLDPKATDVAGGLARQEVVN